MVVQGSGDGWLLEVAAEAHPAAESAGDACTITKIPTTERKRVRKREPQQHKHGRLTMHEAHLWGLMSSSSGAIESVNKQPLPRRI